MTREEAIRRIKAWNLDSDDMGVLAAVIPELRESEDERIRARLIEYFKGFLEGYEDCYKDGGRVKWEGLDVKSILAWLEKQKEQKPAEWSEEDEEISKRIIADLRWGRRNTVSDKDIRQYDEEINWMENRLKSLRPVSKESLQPHWKPSENQMSMLLAVINDPNNAGSESCYISLKSLYNDLKKL